MTGAVLRPFVRPELVWIVRTTGLSALLLRPPLRDRSQRSRPPGRMSTTTPRRVLRALRPELLRSRLRVRAPGDVRADGPTRLLTAAVSPRRLRLSGEDLDRQRRLDASVGGPERCQLLLDEDPGVVEGIFRHAQEPQLPHVDDRVCVDGRDQLVRVTDGRRPACPGQDLVDPLGVAEAERAGRALAGCRWRGRRREAGQRGSDEPRVALDRLPAGEREPAAGSADAGGCWRKRSPARRRTSRRTG